jgi:hypothetical protein
MQSGVRSSLVIVFWFVVRWAKAKEGGIKLPMHRKGTFWAGDAFLVIERLSKAEER